MKSITKWILGISAISLFCTGEAVAQIGYYQDALRFSQMRSTGSARISGLGGTQNSLGGDVSNIHHNPAGLGFFRRSEFSITPGYSNWNTESTLHNFQTGIPTTNFALPNLSLVISNPRDPLAAGKFRGGAFGISVNRLANFNSEFAFGGETNTALIDIFVADAAGATPAILMGENTLEGLAYSAYLISPSSPNSTNYEPISDGIPLMSESVITEGGINQVTFAYGGNFDNKLFLGASLGIASINYTQFKTFTEDFLIDNQELGYDLFEDFFINGTGINLNIGAIYKPVDELNIGLSIQTPTWYRLNEDYTAEIESDFTGTENRGDPRTDLIISTYNLSTPLKINSGVTYFIGKNGFVSADIDYVDYTAANINSRDFNAGPENDAINQLYTATFNYRVGGEFRYDILRFRAGYGYYGDPFRNDFGDPSRHTQQISGGVGVRFANFYVDAAYMNTTFNQFYRSYSGGPVADIRNTINTGMLTVGFNF